MSAVLGTSALAADLSGWAVSDYQQDVYKRQLYMCFVGAIIGRP